MSSVFALPLQAANISQPRDYLADYQRLVQLRNAVENQVLQRQAMQQEMQQRGLGIQQQQMEIESNKNMLRAYSDSGGDPDKFMELSGKYGVLPNHALQLQQGLMQHKLQTYELVGKIGAEAKRQSDLMQGAHDAVDSAKPEDKPAVYAQQLGQLQATGVDTRQMPQQYPGDEGFKVIGVGLRAHTQYVEDALKSAETLKNTAQGQEAQTTTQKTQAELPYIAPQAQANLRKTAAETTEAQSRTQLQQLQAQQIASNPALAGVPAHLIGPATADATKAGEEFSQVNQTASNMRDFLASARAGNKLAYQVLPQEGTLQLTTAQGVHRINRTEIEQYAGAGNAWDSIMGRLGKLKSGQSIPPDVLNDIEALQGKIAGNARNRYENRLKVINQNYGSKFSPVEMTTGGVGPEVTATGPNGHKIKVVNGAWVDAQTGAPIQ